MKGARRTLEPPGSSCDLVSLCKVAHSVVEIDAEHSLRQRDRQETAVFEPEDTGAGHDPKSRAEAAPATADELRRRFVGAQFAEGEWPQRTGAGQELFIGNRVGPNLDPRRHHAS